MPLVKRVVNSIPHDRQLDREKTTKQKPGNNECDTTGYKKQFNNIKWSFCMYCSMFVTYSRVWINRIRLFGYIAYTEQKRENHGTMILDGACYSVIIQLCRVISSRMIENSCGGFFLVVYERPLCFPQCYAANTIRSIHHLSRDS